MSRDASPFDHHAVALQPFFDFAQGGSIQVRHMKESVEPAIPGPPDTELQEWQKDGDVTKRGIRLETSLA